MSDLSAYGRETRPGVKAAGRFMTSPELKASAAPLGVNRATLYFRGRAGALGDVTPLVVTALFGMFPGWLMDLTWEQSRELSMEAAVTAYSEACWTWGRNHLSELADTDELAELSETVVDAVEPSALPLFAAWRGQHRPSDGAARAAHAVNLLRELRGGLHFAALRARGLDVPLAVVAEPGAVSAQLALTGWTEAEIAALERRAAATVDLAERWHAAEDDTDRTFGAVAGVLDAAQRAALQRHLADFAAAAQPS